MIEGKRILALITARGGSKRLPGKNIREFRGKPLIGWTIEAAKGSQYIDCLVLSTDDEEIASVAKAFGCEVPFMRPAALASDEARSVDVALHALENLSESYDYLVLLQPTSPLRSTADIDGCIEVCVKNKADSAGAFSPVSEDSEYIFGIKNGEITGAVSDYENTEDVCAAYGTVYVMHIGWFKQNKQVIVEGTLAYMMPYERSVDIDTEEDWTEAETVSRAGG